MTIEDRKKCETIFLEHLRKLSAGNENFSVNFKKISSDLHISEVDGYYIVQDLEDRGLIRGMKYNGDKISITRSGKEEIPV